MDGWFIGSLHCESLARPCLPICKYCNYTLIKWEVNIRIDGGPIEIIIVFLAPKGIIKDKVMIINIFCYTIYSVFTFVNSDPWICCTNTVNFSCLFFFNKYRSLPHTYCNLKIGGCQVLRTFLLPKSILIKEHIKLSVYIFPCLFILNLSLIFKVFFILHFLAPFLSLLFHLLYILNYWRLLNIIVLIDWWGLHILLLLIIVILVLLIWGRYLLIWPWIIAILLLLLHHSILLIIIL